jgi:hypothetical protein
MKRIITNLKRFACISWSFKKAIIPVFLFLSFFNNAFSELAPKAFSFSELFSKSCALLTGVVSNIRIEKYRYIMEIKVYDDINFIYDGYFHSKPVRIIEDLNNGLYLDDIPYPDTGKVYLFFLEKNGDDFKITNGYAGFFPFDAKDDIRNISLAYHSNKNIFNKENVDNLINLYNSLKTEKIKTRMLYDFEGLLSSGNADFIEQLFSCENLTTKLFGIKYAGITKNPNLKKPIEDMVRLNKDQSLVFNGIVALGEYADSNNILLISTFLLSSDQGTRNVAIQALGKHKNNKIIQPLSDLYKNENEFGNRMSIIDALWLLSDKANVNNILIQFRSIETNTLVQKYLDEKIHGIAINIPSHYTYPLNQNFPNPFNPETKICFEILLTCNVNLEVYDISGRKVRTLLNETRNPGKYDVIFDGRGLPTGVYYYKFSAGNYSELKKMVYIK